MMDRNTAVKLSRTEKRLGKKARRTACTLLVLLILCLNGLAQGAISPLKRASGAGKLNVIIIFTDDQGYGDFSCHGNPVLETPALDRLYGESVRFSDFHVAPLCTPSRGELMSGLDALHNGAFTVGTGRNMLRRDILTMPEIFKDNGYQTGLFGKWHLGDNYPDRPMDRGFQKAVWFKGWGLLSEAEYDNDYYQTRYLDSLKTTYSDKYCTDLWFDEAIKWMNEMKDQDQPFFVYLATNAPHGPFYAPKEDFEFYSTRVKDTAAAKFFGMIRNLDKNTGRLLKWLEEKQLKNNTMVVFMNDNGGTGGVKLYNAGMRGMKGSNYEGGHRAACFITGPEGLIGSPRTLDMATEIQDLLPTFIDLLHLKVRRPFRFDGYSLKSLLQNTGTPADRMFVVQYGGHNRPEKYFSCVVWNSWRLVGKNELYDLSKDPGQEHNLAGEFPAVLHRMQSFYETWWKKAEQSVNTFIPLVVGSENQNPVILTSDFWADSLYVNTQWKVAQAGGSPKGGVWHILLSQGGKYQVELSRWPFHLNRALVAAGPPDAIGGTKLREGKSAAVEFGCISLDDGTPLIARKTKPGANSILFEMQMPKGPHTVRAWFRDEAGRDICGAFYLKLTKITGTGKETSKTQTVKMN
jgi:arylsulfatase A-like enzyme